MPGASPLLPSLITALECPYLALVYRLFISPFSLCLADCALLLHVRPLSISVLLNLDYMRLYIS